MWGQPPGALLPPAASSRVAGGRRVLFQYQPVDCECDQAPHGLP
jgi:hypothetical protein